MLREMTNPAFAHSFKRFARLAVAGLALAGLAACGGGGSSTPAARTPTTPIPTTPTPTTPPPEMSIVPSNKYLSLADGRTENPYKRAWAFGLGANASAAEEEAKTQCDRLLGESCLDPYDAVTDTCDAFAIADECSGTCLIPGVGSAIVSVLVADPNRKFSKQQAETAAIRACETNSSSVTSTASKRSTACVISWS